MLNHRKLKAKIIERGFTIEIISQAMKMHKATFYRKLANNSFLIRETDELKNILRLTNDEAKDIFFDY